MHLTIFKHCSHLANEEETFWIIHTLSGQLRHRNQTLHIFIETDDAAKLLHTYDEAVRDAAHPGIRVRLEDRARGLDKGLFPGQDQPLVLNVH